MAGTHRTVRPAAPMATAVELDRRTLLADSFVARLHSLNYAPSTVRRYRGSVRRFFTTYPTLVLEAVTPEHIERHLFDRSVSNRSKATELEELRAFFKYLVRMKVLAENPCARAEAPRWKFRQKPAPSWDDFLAMRNACPDAETALLLELPYFTGLRHSEFRGLQVRHVDLAHRQIRVVGKGGKERTVVFPPRVGALIGQVTQGRPSDAWLIATPGRRQRWGFHAANETLRALGTGAGLPYPVTAHTLRHGFARLCKTREVPVEIAAKLLGHESIATTVRIYGRLGTEDLQASYDRHIGDVE